MPILARTVGKKTDGGDTLVKVRVSSLGNPISNKSAGVRGAARALIEAGLVNPVTADPIKTALNSGDTISTIEQKIVEGEADRIHTAEITYRVAR